jgi:hypothetical protein
MRLKTKLVLAITGLVFLVVCTLSWIFLGQLLRQRMSQAYSANDMVAHQILFATRGALATNIRGPRVDPNNPQSVRAAAAQALRSDPALTALMNSAIRYSPTVFDVAIADSEGRALLSTDPTNVDHLLPHRQEYEELESGGLLRQLEVVFGPPRVYNVTLPVRHPVVHPRCPRGAGQRFGGALSRHQPGGDPGLPVARRLLPQHPPGEAGTRVI